MTREEAMRQAHPGGGTMSNTPPPPEQRVAEALIEAHLRAESFRGSANAALDAVRDTLASSDPEMATRLGLVRIAGPGSNGRTWETYGTPWQEVPDADE